MLVTTSLRASHGVLGCREMSFYLPPRPHLAPIPPVHKIALQLTEHLQLQFRLQLHRVDIFPSTQSLIPNEVPKENTPGTTTVNDSSHKH